MTTLSELRIVLVTGAGASRELGADERKMPLMADWATTLAEALDSAESGLAQACHLSPSMNGEEFEQVLGQLLTWGRSLAFQATFSDLATEQLGSRGSGYKAGVELAERRWPTIRRTINNTLFREFGLNRINGQAAENAYAGLLRALEVQADGAQLFCATTNYDPSLEVALDRLGSVNVGFGGVKFGTPQLDPEQFDPWEQREVPLVHLHGAVGWYRDDSGAIFQVPGDQAFDDRRIPVLVYPDPAKNPFEEPGVSQLWAAFRRSLGTATHVVVVGHSLHDRPLLEAIAEATDKNCRIAFACYDVAERTGFTERIQAIPRFRLRERRIQFPQCTIGSGSQYEELEAWFRSMG